MIIWYKNSFLASLVSIIGCITAVGGIATFSEDVAGAIALIAVGVALAIWGRSISKNKSFKKWWKQIEDNNLETAIARDLNTAIAIYQKNPDKRTIKKIGELNPQFATYIEEKVAKKK